MIDHDRARELASARADGELDRAGDPRALAAELSEHLEGCAGCRAFAEGLRDLRRLAEALPKERAPAGFADRVDARVAAEAARPARRRWFARPVARLAPAFAVVLAVALIAVLFQPARRFDLPRAEAAEALTKITSLYMEREITEFRGDERTTTRERIWWRAPALLRVEQTQTRPDGTTSRRLQINRAGRSYTKDEDGERLDVGVPPPARGGLLPVPLQPAIALIGTDLGAGPLVAGRATRRVSATLGDERREALLDADRFTVLGSEEQVLLEKVTIAGERLVIRKRTLEVRYNPAMPDPIFEQPEATVNDLGFRPVPLSDLAIAPDAVPSGFAVVQAGRWRGGEEILLARGAVQVLVVGRAIQPGHPNLRRVTVGARPATLALDFDVPPRIEFVANGARLVLQAPLPPDRLVELAAKMYPE